jgi:hypothetical protein
MSEPRIIFLSNTQPGNYIEKVCEAMRHNPPRRNSINHIEICHEYDCGLYSEKKVCDCCPEIKIREFEHE